MSRFLEPRPEVLVKHGKVNRKAAKREMITQDELEAQLREQGVEDIGNVRVARMEGDGQLSVLTYDRGDAPKPKTLPPRDARPPDG